ncbi:YciI family protein [Micromonospora echinaurantiaca]|uniref:YciI family protein n=1 Tax=Micromonospora echinaurantiaca TaxID=47857 RepID=UPI00371D04ED
MKYMILLYGSQRDYDVLAGRSAADKPAMSAEDVAAMHAHMEKVHQALAESGELVDARGLVAPVHARRVQVSGGLPVVTDGPYPETQEVLAGYTIVECDSFDRATEIAAGFVNPDAPGEYVDVRPVAEGIADLDG